MTGPINLLVSEDILNEAEEVIRLEGFEHVLVIPYPPSWTEEKADWSAMMRLTSERGSPARCNCLVATDRMDPGAPPKEIGRWKVMSVPNLQDLFVDHGSLDGRKETSLKKAKVGKELFRARLSQFLLSAMMEVEMEKARSAQLAMERTRSDFMTIFDVLDRVSLVRDEDAVVNSILDLFVILFSPRALYYATVKNDAYVNKFAVGGSAGETWEPDQAAKACGSSSSVPTDHGFCARIDHMGSPLGILEVRDLAFPQHRERYLELARDICSVFGIALSNARAYQELERIQKVVLDLNESLNITNKITRHDIRNELIITYGALELFKRSHDDAKLDMAMRSIVKVEEQLTQLKELDMMLTKGGPLRPTDLRKVVEKVAAGYPMHISIIGEGSALVDQAFHSVVDNLVRNAMMHGKAENVTITFQDDGKIITMAVADDGKGIEEGIRDKIFNEGFSHGETKGTGLGLFIVARTMGRYQGTIKVRSNSPRGTVFDLTFPSMRW